MSRRPINGNKKLKKKKKATSMWGLKARHNYLRYCQGRAPLLFEDIQTNTAITVDIRMEDLGFERHLLSAPDVMKTDWSYFWYSISLNVIIASEAKKVAKVKSACLQYIKTEWWKPWLENAYSMLIHKCFAYQKHIRCGLLSQIYKMMIPQLTYQQFK